ncbi:MAG: alpha-ketoglutarate-dependent dioxygenase AlkB [Corynebacterium nuruki]|nr:alpha-ketoglutarate-dependent dioxygenase AlkB [Corynebacterium nuruki]
MTGTTPSLFDLPDAAGDVGDAGTPDLPAGAVHVPGWLTEVQQQDLLDRVATWARGPVAPARPHTASGEMSSRMLCLGRHWVPTAPRGHRYFDRAVDGNGAPVLPVPPELVTLARRAVFAATGDGRAAGRYSPDIAVVNIYGPDAHMGMHRDDDEASEAPVVSLSLGAACRFRFGNATDRSRPYTDLTLAPGDLFVFGGPARWNFHGVQKILDPATRVNITVRESGL